MSAPADDPRVLLEETVPCPTCGQDVPVPGGAFDSAEVYEAVGLAAVRRHALAAGGHLELLAQLSDLDDDAQAPS